MFRTRPELPDLRPAATEDRSLTVQALNWGAPQSVDIPEGYGHSGGYWGSGMVWNQVAAVSPVVAPDSAMTLSAVYACLRLLSEAIATLPLDVFTRENGTRKPYRPRPAYLSFDPPQESRIDYLSRVMLSLLIDGNAFVAVIRDAVGEPVDLIVLDPTCVQVKRYAGRKVFVIGDRELTTYEIMHISGMTLPGATRGVSPLAAAREVIDGARKAQEYGRNFVGNNSVPPAVIQIPGDKSKEQAKAIAERWKDTHGGTGNAGIIGVLSGGAELKTIAISPEDAQWLDSKRFSVSEIARFYGVPPHLIADASNSTSWGSGLAEQNLAFAQFSLRPWLERIEDGHTRLESTAGRPQVFIKLNLDALLRASLKDRYEAYAIGIQNKFVLPNEARKKEDEPPLPGGNEFPVLAPGGAA